MPSAARSSLRSSGSWRAPPRAGDSRLAVGQRLFAHRLLQRRASRLQCSRPDAALTYDISAVRSGAVTSPHFDVLVDGAGISGICAGYHLQTQCPDRTYAILEARDDIGGTWDLFRYPGIRSDSDMYTLGYSFKPWTSPKAIADGPSILAYLRETAREHGIDREIRFGHRVK